MALHFKIVTRRNLQYPTNWERYSAAAPIVGGSYFASITNGNKSLFLALAASCCLTLLWLKQNNSIALPQGGMGALINDSDYQNGAAFVGRTSAGKTRMRSTTTNQFLLQSNNRIRYLVAPTRYRKVS